MQTSEQIKNNISFKILNNYIYPILHYFYNIKTNGLENIPLDRPVMFISRHTSHNLEIYIGL